MKYIIINNKFIDLKQWDKDLHEVWLELNEKGEVLKEIGFNCNMQITYIYPSDKYMYGKRGIFDSTIFDMTKLTNEISSTDFYSVMNSNLSYPEKN